MQGTHAARPLPFLTLWCLARRATASLMQDVLPRDLAGGVAVSTSRVALWRERLVLWLRTGYVPK